MKYVGAEMYKIIHFYFEDENNEYTVIYDETADGVWINEWTVKTVDEDVVEGELRTQLISAAKKQLQKIEITNDII